MNVIKETQKALNNLFVLNLAIDGVVGKVETIPALEHLAGRLHLAFAAKDYFLDYSKINLIGIRTSNEYTNNFTDYYVMHDPNNPSSTRIVPCSTKPGLYGLGAIMNPFKNGTRKKGTAVIAEGQYIDAWSLHGNLSYSWWSGLPFLYQEKPIPVYRDGNMDMQINGSIEVAARAGLNHHSWTGYKDWWQVNNLSTGCQVMSADALRVVYPYWKMLADGNSNLVSYTLIDSRDLA